MNNGVWKSFNRHPKKSNFPRSDRAESGVSVFLVKNWTPRPFFIDLEFWTPRLCRTIGEKRPKKTLKNPTQKCFWSILEVFFGQNQKSDSQHPPQLSSANSIYYLGSALAINPEDLRPKQIFQYAYFSTFLTQILKISYKIIR